MLKGILFDLDGVLVDSEGIYFRAVRDSFRPYGIEISEQEYVKRWMIERTKSRGAIRDYGLNASVEQVRQIKDRFFEEYAKDLQMIPGALEMLERFKGKYPLGLVSSEIRREVLRKTSKFDLMKRFKVSVCGGEVRRDKPYPEPYQRGCELLGLDPEDVLVVEDNPSGVKSGKGAGCKVVARPDGFTKGMDFSLADKVVESFDEINDDLIGRLFGN